MSYYYDSSGEKKKRETCQEKTETIIADARSLLRLASRPDFHPARNLRVLPHFSYTCSRPSYLFHTCVHYTSFFLITTSTSMSLSASIHNLQAHIFDFDF